MKTTHFFVAALGLLVGLTASNLMAQGAHTATQSVRPTIAVINLSRVFKEHPAFEAQMAQLKSRVEQEDAAMKARADRLQKQVETIKGYNAGSPEYKSLEKAIASEQAQMRIDIQAQRKEFLQQEAKIYHLIYTDVKNTVKAYARQVGLAAVIRYASPPTESDPNQPDQVLSEIQKDLVYFNPGLDITDHILTSLRRQYPAATAGTTPPQRPTVPYPASRPTVPPRQY